MRRLSPLLAGLLAACSGRDAEVAAPDAPSGPPTWHEQVAPVLARSCSGCHREGGLAPFDLTRYDRARPLALAIAAAVESGTMPPWHAVETAECEPRLPWKNDVRLSAADRSLVARWAAAGAPEGDPARAVPLPPPPRFDLEAPSARVAMAQPWVTDGPRDQFRCFLLPFTAPEDLWLTGLQVVPGNDKVVHHVLVFADTAGAAARRAGPDGSFDCFGGGFSGLIGAWAPGALPMDAPPTVGVPLQKGGRIVLNVHYHPAGRREADQTAVDLRWVSKKPPLEATIALIGNFSRQDPRTGDGLLPGPNDPPTGPAFLIPAGARDHLETLRFTIDDRLAVGGRLWTVGTHMHLAGTSMRIEIDRSKRAGGREPGEPAGECLIETPRWDFHWQRGYSYDAPVAALPSVRAGDIVTLRCRYDNSMENPHVREGLAEVGAGAPQDIRLGEETMDEMCLGVFGIVHPARP